MHFNMLSCPSAKFLLCFQSHFDVRVMYGFWVTKTMNTFWQKGVCESW